MESLARLGRGSPNDSPFDLARSACEDQLPGECAKQRLRHRVGAKRPEPTQLFCCTANEWVVAELLEKVKRGEMSKSQQRALSGDTVEVITSGTQSPSKDWLKIVKSSRAKAKIRAFIKQQERDRALALGKDVLYRYDDDLGALNVELGARAYLLPRLGQLQLQRRRGEQ